MSISEDHRSSAGLERISHAFVGAPAINNITAYDRSAERKTARTK
jgi:hypothetical protein